MVPHTRVLAAIALVARCSGDEEHTRDHLCRLHSVRFPPDLLGTTAFWLTEVIQRLPAEQQIALQTAQPHLTGDYNIMFDVAKTLGVDDIITLGGSTTPEIHASSPFVSMDAEIIAWRRHPAMRMAIETMLLCDVPLETIGEDMRKMYGRTYETSYLTKFKQFYCDKSLLGDWSAYSRCIAPEEMTFKYRLMQEPLDFVRWKLGVPVHLDNETVLDRLMSDAYYTERMLKHEARGVDPHGLPIIGQADLARIKMERDTVFKCMDRKIRMREQAGAQNAASSMLHQQMAQLTLDYSTQTSPLVSELTDG